MQERRGGREGYWRRKKSMYSQQSAFLWLHQRLKMARKMNFIMFPGEKRIA